MKWLLVTTTPERKEREWNIGDVFARLGTEMLIREIDARAEFDFIDMNDSESVVTPRPFDRCVLAGRPLFWKECERYPEWTHILHGWPGVDRKKVLIFGVGTCYPLGDYSEHLHSRLIDASALSFGKPIVRFNTDDPAAEPAVCPASFVLLDRGANQQVKLCNFMPTGGHYSQFAPDQSACWLKKETEIAHILISNGFVAVAHTERELEHARLLAFGPDKIVYSKNINDYLAVYSEASHYIGNRMHGAVICCSLHANVIAVGFDSRLGMVTAAGGATVIPSEISTDQITRFATSPAANYDDRINYIRSIRAKMRKRLEEFANQP